MPIDLAEDNDEMFYYFSNILSDLHGKKAERWNVSHQSDFIMPQTDDCDPTSDNDSADFEFQVSSRMMPTEYVFADKQGRYILAVDLKQATSVDVSRHLGSTSKFDTVEMSTEDFLRLGHCCVLGAKPNPEIHKKDKVCLVKMDSHVKKLIEKSWQELVRVTRTKRWLAYIFNFCDKKTKTHIFLRNKVLLNSIIWGYKLATLNVCTCNWKFIVNFLSILIIIVLLGFF